MGAHLNVKINAGSLKDKAFVDGCLKQADEIAAKAQAEEAEILKIVEAKMQEG
jgi:glutamate formiminotransferase/formiminotetrahydrofolate cyclodeaminase